MTTIAPTSLANRRALPTQTIPYTLTKPTLLEHLPDPITPLCKRLEWLITVQGAGFQVELLQPLHPVRGVQVLPSWKSNHAITSQTTDRKKKNRCNRYFSSILSFSLFYTFLIFGINSHLSTLPCNRRDLWSNIIYLVTRSITYHFMEFFYVQILWTNDLQNKVHDVETVFEALPSPEPSSLSKLTSHTLVHLS